MSNTKIGSIFNETYTRCGYEVHGTILL